MATKGDTWSWTGGAEVLIKDMGTIWDPARLKCWINVTCAEVGNVRYGHVEEYPNSWKYTLKYREGIKGCGVCDLLVPSNDSEGNVNRKKQ